MDSTEDGCVKALKHTSCQPGQYISQKGWFSHADFKITSVDFSIPRESCARPLNASPADYQ